MMSSSTIRFVLTIAWITVLVANSASLYALPNRGIYVFDGEGHNAMDNQPTEFAQTVTNFLLNHAKASAR